MERKEVLSLSLWRSENCSPIQLAFEVACPRRTLDKSLWVDTFIYSGNFAVPYHSRAMFNWEVVTQEAPILLRNTFISTKRKGDDSVVL